MATRRNKDRTSSAAKRAADKARENADALEMSDEEKKAAEKARKDAEKKAKAEQAEKERNIALEKQRGIINEASEHIATAEKEGTEVIREAWLAFGRALNAGQELFRGAKGGLNKKGFGKWVDGEGFASRVSDRNLRSASMWLATMVHDAPEIIDMAPVTLGNPQSIQKWANSMKNDIFKELKTSPNDLVALDTNKAKDEEFQASAEAMTKVYDQWAEDAGGEAGQEYKEKADFIRHWPDPVHLAMGFHTYTVREGQPAFRDRDVDDACLYLSKLIASHDKSEAIIENLTAAYRAYLKELEDEAKKEAEAEEAEAKESEVEEETSETETTADASDDGEAEEDNEQSSDEDDEAAADAAARDAENEEESDDDSSDDDDDFNFDEEED